MLGVSDRVIGLTIVAVGTSLPELFSSVAAARKGQTDMAIGNVVGSAIFNLLCVVGISAAISPIYNTNDGFLTDYICMVALSGLLWFFLSTKKTLERWEGIVLVTIYVGYITYTVI
jgi:cation:H+ antiporter